MTGRAGQREVVLGAPAALEETFLARVGEVRATAPLAPVDVLVGGILQRPYLQRLLAERGPGMVNVRVSTLGELGLRLGADTLARAGRRPLPALAERALTQEVAADSVGYFTPVAHTPGFAEAAHRTLRELRQEGIGPEDLDPAAMESAAKAADLRDLVARHVEARRGFADGLDALAEARPERFDGALLIMSGVWRLGALAKRLVAGIAGRAGLVVLLPELDPVADQAHAELRAWLDELGATVTRPPDPEPADALGHLRSHLFAPGAPAPADASVDLVSAPEPLAEVREAARACLGWAAEGITFREMAVSYRQAEAYRPLVEAVFAEAGIPVYLDDGPSLAERPVGRRILALLDLVGTPLRRAELIAFVSDGWMPEATRERFGGAPRSAWDAASRRAGVVEGPEEWAARLGAYADRLRAEAGDEPEEWRERRIAAAESLAAFVADLAARLAAAPARAGWGRMLDWLTPLLEDLVEDADPVLGYLAGLRELDHVLGEVPLARFLDVVRAEVRALRAGDLDEGRQGAFGRRGVNVLDVNQLAGLRFRCVAVLGLAERAFPPPPRQDPLLLDAERRRLNAAGGLTIPLRAEGPDPEPLGFALAVHAARERILLSTRRADEAGGRAQLPSVFFRMAAGALAGERVDAERVERLPTVRRLPAGRVGAPELGRGLTVAERDRTLLEVDPALGRAVLERLQPRAARADALRRARWGTRGLTTHDGVFAGPDALAAVAALLAARPLSPTGVERYAGCPYRHLLAGFLHVRPLTDPEGILRMDPLTRGSVIHAVLERFVGDLGRAPAAGDLPALMAIAEAELDEAEAAGLTGMPLLWAADRREIIEDLGRWLTDEAAGGGYGGVEVEVSFGRPEEDGHPEPLVIDVDGREVRFAGRIDRLDRDGPGGRFRVVDYKTGGGWGLPRDGSLKGGTALQLPLYLLAGAMILDADPANGEAAYHLVTRRGGFRRIDFDGAVLAERREELQRVLERIVGGIEAGDFHAEPGKNGEACRYCDFASACDVGRGRLRARKAGDPRIVSFEAMRAVG